MLAQCRIPGHGIQESLLDYSLKLRGMPMFVHARRSSVVLSKNYCRGQSSRDRGRAATIPRLSSCRACRSRCSPRRKGFPDGRITICMICHRKLHLDDVGIQECAFQSCQSLIKVHNALCDRENLHLCTGGCSFAEKSWKYCNPYKGDHCFAEGNH